MPLPTGTVTFLFTDIAGSTMLWEKAPHAMSEALQRHDRILRAAIENNGGAVFKTVGDGDYAAFENAENALRAAIAGQSAISEEIWGELEQFRVRIAMHTGVAESRDGDYFGATLSRLARILSFAHPGQILVSSTSAQLLANRTPDEVRLIDLGEFELRGLINPERIFQAVHPALPATFDEIKGMRGSSSNLPLQLSSFVGREAELAQVLSLLRRSRLVTLSGSGGAGKTRLALQAASDSATLYADGVWFAELAPVAEEDSVCRTVSQAMRVTEIPGRTGLATLCDSVRHKSLLLVLDNCEHVLDACAEITAALLQNASGLHILATSREALGVPGETTVRIPSMGVPAPEEAIKAQTLQEFDATRLFVERATSATPSFLPNDVSSPIVAQICRRLDGIPLAIELAASRLRGMPLQQLADRLDDRFRVLTGGSRTAVSRQRTLRALIDWSYDLLTENERSLLRTLSVFAGGWTLEAAERVGAYSEIGAFEAPDLLSQLVEKSLVNYEVQRDETARYTLLETIRQYASDRLLDEGEVEATRTRHFYYFHEFLTQTSIGAAAGEGSEGSEPFNPAAVALAEATVLGNWENLRAAIDWALVVEPEKALEMAIALGGFYQRGGRIQEGSQIVAHALQVSGSMGATTKRQNAYLIGARLAFRKTDFSSAAAMAENSRAMAESLSDEEGAAEAMTVTGNLHIKDSEFEPAEKIFSQIRDVGRRHSNSALEARGAYGLMWHARQTGNFVEWEQYLDESTRLFAKAGLSFWVLWMDSYRASLAEEKGQVGKAAAGYADAMNRFARFEPGITGIWHWECFARLSSVAEMHQATATLFGAAQAHRDRLAWPVQTTEVARNERAKQRSAQALGESYQVHYNAGALLSYEEASNTALSVASSIAAKN